MASQEVHGCPEVLRRVVLVEAHNAGRRFPGAFPPKHVLEEDVPERVVHHRVELFSQKILAPLSVAYLVARVFPDLADKNGFRVRFFHGLPETADKLIGKFVGHVQAPASGPLPKPISGHTVFLPQDKFHVRWLQFVYVGKVFFAPPALVTASGTLQPVPRVIRRYFGLESPQFGVMSVPIEVTAVGSRVAEDAVEDDGYPPTPRLLYQQGKCLQVAVHGVDLEVVSRVVLVVACRFEDWVKVERAYAELFQVRQFGDYAQQVTAEEVPSFNPPLFVSYIERGVVPMGMY